LIERYRIKEFTAYSPLSHDHKKRMMNKEIKKKTGVKKITQFEIIRHQVAGIDVSDNGGMMAAYSVSEKYPW
jgi:hypothetical protein